MDRARLVALIGVIGLCLTGDEFPSSSDVRDERTMQTACGPAIPKPGGGVWECTFADEFNGTTLDRTKWHPQTDFGTGASSPSARSCHVDDQRNIAVRQGSLRLTVRRMSSPVECHGRRANYTSAMVSTYRLFSQQYGRFESRFKNTATTRSGLQESFWLWPDVRVPSLIAWPAAGEIDIVETYSQYPRLAVPFLHYTSNDNGGPIPGINTAWNCQAARGVFNTYALTWTPATLTVEVNGKTCLHNTSGDPAFQKPYIVAFTAALGVGKNELRWHTPMPATMQVDYVRVWR